MSGSGWTAYEPPFGRTLGGGPSGNGWGTGDHGASEFPIPRYNKGGRGRGYGDEKSGDDGRGWGFTASVNHRIPGWGFTHPGYLPDYIPHIDMTADEERLVKAVRTLEGL